MPHYLPNPILCKFASRLGLQRRLSEINCSLFFFLYCALALIYAIFGSLYFVKQISADGFLSLTFFDPVFEWAGLTETVYRLQNNLGYQATFDGLIFHAHRMPAIPLLMAAFAFISKKAVLFLIFKNCTLYLLFAASSGLIFYKGATLGQFIAFIGLFYLNPLFFHAFPFIYEEGFTTLTLASAFCLIMLFDIRANFLASFLAAALYLTKSTLNLTCFLFVAFAYFHPANRERRIAITILLPIGLATFGWGMITYDSTGRFAFGSSLSSLNGSNFYRGNNEHTDDVYPTQSLDNLQNRYVFWGYTLDGTKLSNEWEANDYYFTQAVNFIRNNPGLTARRLAQRFFLVFLEFREWARSGGNFPVWPFLLVNRIVMLSCLVCAFLKSMQGDSNSKFIARLYLGIVATYSLPLILGFVYMRHLIPLFAVSIVYFPLLVGEEGND